MNWSTVTERSTKLIFLSRCTPSYRHCEMSSNGASFLPRLESVFYAVFDVEQGPKIVSQVPEALIATSTTSALSSGSSGSLFAVSPASATSPFDFDFPSRTSSSSLLSSPTSQRVDSMNGILSPHKRGTSTNRFLFHFDDISRYVIPPKALCGRLVICTTKSHRILGFPVRLDDETYPRNYFLYNVCFVFERTADLSCYEPIARKMSRVLTNCEVRRSPPTHPGSCINGMGRKSLAFCLHRRLQERFPRSWNSCTKISTHTPRLPFPSTSSTLSS